MRSRISIWLLTLSLCSCAAEPEYDPFDDYVELDSTTVLDAPSVDPADVAPRHRDAVRRGEYMVELLGCGTCHTPGAFDGAPDYSASLSGSDIGIAYTSPLIGRYPGVVFPPNITSDIETGIGGWSDEQMDSAIRSGMDRHGRQSAPVMPWPGYARLSDEDTAAIIIYLRNLKPVRNRVPDDVRPGNPTAESYVYFGFYTPKD